MTDANNWTILISEAERAAQQEEEEMKASTWVLMTLMICAVWMALSTSAIAVVATYVALHAH